MVVLYNTTDLILLDLVRAPGLTKAHTEKRGKVRSVSPSLIHEWPWQRMTVWIYSIAGE